ncbi:MAG: OmpA family protein [Halofilum sp. (in: g-proteobacteria)]|nr:OmpA family protein [Halofilum sp. (in: g-proteobacteria)]
MTCNRPVQGADSALVRPRLPGPAGPRLWPLAGALLATLTLQGCLMAEPQVRIIPVEQQQGPEPAATAAEPDRVREPEPEEVAVLDPKRAGAQVAERTADLTRREELRLSRAEAGYYMDVQEAQLRQRLQAQPVDILRDADSLLIRISGDAGFRPGSSELGAGLRELLATVAEVLGEYRKTLVIVNSHTDQSGDAAVNQRLSEARAVAVSRFLATRGVAPDRLAAVGHGESKPLSRFAGSAGPNLNRRLELRLQLLVDSRS